MKKVLKRMVSMFLAMILVLGVWQTPVYASGIDDNGQGNAVNVKPLALTNS